MSSFSFSPVLHPTAWNMNVMAGNPTDILEHKDKGPRDQGVENLKNLDS